MQAKAKVNILKPCTFQSPEIRRKPTLRVAGGGCQLGKCLVSKKRLKKNWEKKTPGKKSGKNASDRNAFLKVVNSDASLI